MTRANSTLKLIGISSIDQEFSFVNLQNNIVLRTQPPFSIEFIAQLDPQDSFRLGYFLCAQEIHKEKNFVNTN